MDSRLNAKELNVMDSGYRFSDMGGILLFLDSGIFFATQWDDKPVVLYDVMHALKPKSKPETKAGGLADAKEISVAASTPVIVKRPAASTPIIVKRPAAASPLSNNKPTAPAPASANKSVEQKLDIANKKENTEVNPLKYILPGGGMMNIGVAYSRPKTHTNPWELVDKYNKYQEKKVPEGEKKVYGIKRNKSLETNAKDLVSKAMDNTEAPLEKATEEGKQRENPLAERIFANYPRIYPFEDNEITRCVKIEPKDIGALPSDAWILSNNSFLLHGYYCYHHLIFAEISDSYGCRYILGIPGIYHNRERFMARMFGFECFKSIRKRQLKQGDFGYWYLEVNF